MRETLLGLLLSLPAFFLAISVHESAHGYMAYKMGDPTAKYMGRLTLNPIAHFDLIGGLCLLLFHFGWAKPVPINPQNFKNRKKGVILVSLAGPVSNIIFAIVSALVLAVSGKLMGISDVNFLFNVSAYLLGNGLTQMSGVVVLLPMLYYCVILNIGLAVFNLIPIPPLDGSKILLELLPYKARDFFYSIERYSMIIMLVVIYTGILNPVLSVLQNGLFMLVKLVISPLF